MAKKTETLSVTGSLDGSTLRSAVESFTITLIALENEGVRTGRVILYDTLEVSIERELFNDQTVGGETAVDSYTTIQMRALAVLS